MVDIVTYFRVRTCTKVSTILVLSAQKTSTMKMTITGSLGNIGWCLATQLIAKGHQVTVISHSSQRIEAIRTLDADPAIGSIEDADFLASAFEGADAVFLMIPPRFDSVDTRVYMRSVADAYFDAISRAG